MLSHTTQDALRLDYSDQRPRRRRWPWIAGTVLVLVGIAAVAAYMLVPAYSIHKSRELNLQAGILNAKPGTPHLVRQWDPATAGGEQSWQNWTHGPNAYDSVDARAIVYPILRAAMLDGSERRAVLVWLGAERADGLDIQYAIIEPGGRFSPSRLLNSGAQAFDGTMSQQPIRVWSATFPENDRSRFVFDFEVAGVRRSAEATLAGSKLSFNTGTALSIR